MIAMYGPSWPRRVDRRAERGHYEPHDEPPFLVDAQTLGDALSAYEERFSVDIKPYDGSIDHFPLEAGTPPKYFFYVQADGDQFVVDIHVTRGNEELCPKQDLVFALLADDLIEIGGLIC